MSIKRFVAPNGREALAQVRRELGEDALVLSTRKLSGGHTEVLAVGGDEMHTLFENASGPCEPATHVAPAISAKAKAKAKAASAGVHAPASGVRTESFEQFLQRQARLQAQRGPATAPTVAAAASSGASDEPVAKNPGDRAHSGESPVQPPTAAGQRAGSLSVASDARPVAPIAGPSVPTATRREAVPPEASPAPLNAVADARLLAELQSMRALLLEQMATVSTANAAADLQRRNPMQVRAMTRLLMAGFSAYVARHIAERAPAASTPERIDRWLAKVLMLNVRCVDADSDWLNRGGVFALVGPTGVGKTTTVAKLAARFAVRHGAQSLGLITLDAFRVGAHEQLRTYGRILGTPVHLAQDMATLRELLASMAGKRLVLIDTCGVSQRDERLGEMLQMLEQAGVGQRPIERLLLLNAASHAETLDDVARAWQARQCAGAVLTKLDEAVRIGGALDCLLRYKLNVLGATNGQRVPEDWVTADARDLAVLALQPGQNAFVMAEADGAALAAHARQMSVAMAG